MGTTRQATRRSEIYMATTSKNPKNSDDPALMPVEVPTLDLTGQAGETAEEHSTLSAPLPPELVPLAVAEKVTEKAESTDPTLVAVPPAASALLVRLVSLATRPMPEPTRA